MATRAVLKNLQIRNKRVMYLEIDSCLNTVSKALLVKHPSSFLYESNPTERIVALDRMPIVAKDLENLGRSLITKEIKPVPVPEPLPTPTPITISPAPVRPSPKPVNPSPTVKPILSVRTNYWVVRLTPHVQSAQEVVNSLDFVLAGSQSVANHSQEYIFYKANSKNNPSPTITKLKISSEIERFEQITAKNHSGR